MTLFRRRPDPVVVRVQLHQRPFTEAEVVEHFRRGLRDNAEWHQALRQLLGEMIEERVEVLANPGLAAPEENRHHVAGALAALTDLAAFIEQPGVPAGREEEERA